jgi:probable F420-dependent oxidoreductase
VKFGLAFGALNPNRWVSVARVADRLGYESLWVPEHLVLPIATAGSPLEGIGHPPLDPTVPVFDVFAYLGYLAATTKSICLGTYVYNIGLRHPFVTARAAATVDVLSDGRLYLGVGASWLRAEWEASGLDFDSRGARVDEAISVCQMLWTEPVVEHHGRFYDFDPVAFEPKPVQAGGVPLHVGGDGPAAIRRAARFGSGWAPINHTLAQLRPAVGRLEQLSEGFGRDSRPQVTISARVERPEDVEPYARAGADRLIVRPWKRSAEAVEAVERFAAEVLAS